jgi:drug/metabolite transporter (DMT)-like permease
MARLQSAAVNNFGNAPTVGPVPRFRWRASEWHAVLLFILGALWGLQFTLLKIASGSHLSEVGILSVSMLLLAAAFVVTLVACRACFRPTRQHVRFFILSGLFGFVLPLGSIIYVAEHLSAGLIVFYESLTPIVTVAMALGLRTETLSAQRIAAVALGMLGIVVVLWPELSVPQGARFEALIVAFIIPLAFAADGIYVASRWPNDLRAIQVVTGETVAGCAMLLPFYLCSGESFAFPRDWQSGEWAMLAFVPVSFLEVCLYFYLLKNAGAVFVSVASFISLFAGIFWGMTFLGEEHPLSVWIAVIFVSLALYMVTVKKSNAPITRLLNWSP